MKYIVKAVESNPEGTHCGTQYYVCETEREMERMINAFKNGYPYFVATCIGPVATPCKWVKDVIDAYV